MNKKSKLPVAILALALGATIGVANAYAQEEDNPLGRNLDRGQLLPSQAWIVAPDDEKGPGTLANVPTGYQVSELGLGTRAYKKHHPQHQSHQHKVKASKGKQMGG